MTRHAAISPAAFFWGIVLLALTFLAYRPALADGWIWDDDDYVTANPYLHDLGGLKTLWMNPHARHQYYPLVQSTFWAEQHIWGLNPMGFHLTNILLQGCAALLVWRVLVRLGFGEPPDGNAGSPHGSRWLPGAAWVVGALFALHPICVESVAWVTERKNMLMAVFYLLAMWAYLHFEPGGLGVQSSEFRVEGERGASHGAMRRQEAGAATEPVAFRVPVSAGAPTHNSEPRTQKSEPSHAWRWYALALLFFIAAMLSKTVAASFPVAVLILIWWKRGGWRLGQVAALTPFLAIGGCLGLLTAWLEKNEVGAEGPEWALSFPQRVLIAGRALWFYAGKLAWPRGLCFVYPHWTIDPHQLWQWGFPIGALVLALVLLAGMRFWGRGPAAGAAFFAVTLAPALGFLNVYPFRFSYVADHFQYVAALGLLALGVGVVTHVLRKAGSLPLKIGGSVLAAAVLTICGQITYARCPVFANRETLWRDTLATNNTAWLAHNDLGLILASQGKTDEAIAHFRRTLELKADHVMARTNLGVALEAKGDMRGARAEYERVVREEPGYPDAHNALGKLLFAQGDVNGAIEQYREALQVNPHFPEALVNLGIALASQGQTGAAIGQFESALLARPGYAVAHADLGALLEKQGDLRGAQQHFAAAVASEPGSPEYRKSLARVLLVQGHADDAVNQLRQGVAANPDDAEAQLQLGRALTRSGHANEALAHFQRAIQLRPNDSGAHNAMGVALATLHRVDDAVAEFQEAVRLKPADSDARDNLRRAKSMRAGQGQ